MSSSVQVFIALFTFLFPLYESHLVSLYIVYLNILFTL